MRITFLTLCLTSLFVAGVDAKNKSINWQQAKVAVEIDIKDQFEQVKIGFTAFGDYKSDEHATEFDMPTYIINHLELIFDEIGIEYELVERQMPGEAELSTLKRKAKRKLYKKINKDHLNHLQNKGFSDLLVIKFFSHTIRDHRYGIPKIDGFGMYKIPGANCVYHTLGYNHQNLNGRGKSSLYNVVEKIPEKNKVDHVCLFGRNVKPMGIEWKKESADYSELELSRIESELKNLLLKGLLDTFQKQGMIENQLSANQLYVNLTQSDYLVVEKLSKDQFTINENIYDRIELIQFLNQFISENTQGKILVGLKSKSKYTFGELKEIFIPIIKATSNKLYRLGPEYELIEI